MCATHGGIITPPRGFCQIAPKAKPHTPARLFAFQEVNIMLQQERCTTRGVSLPQALDDRLKAQAKREQRKVSTVIARALTMYLAKAEAPEEKAKEFFT